MEIIDELEPLSRGPYTGALGYLGFNRESQLSIIIRAALCKDGAAHFPVGAGIVADSNPVAEFEETLAKARGFLAALELELPEGLAIDERFSDRRPRRPRAATFADPDGLSRRGAEKNLILNTSGFVISKRKNRICAARRCPVESNEPTTG